MLSFCEANSIVSHFLALYGRCTYVLPPVSGAMIIKSQWKCNWDGDVSLWKLTICFRDEHTHQKNNELWLTILRDITRVPHVWEHPSQLPYYTQVNQAVIMRTIENHGWMRVAAISFKTFSIFRINIVVSCDEGCWPNWIGVKQINCPTIESGQKVGVLQK